MRFLVRWAFRCLILCVVLAVGVLLLKNALAKSVAIRTFSAQTGLDVKIGSLDLGVFTPTLTIENVRVYNPPEFGGSPVVDLPELHVEWDPHALAKRRLRLRLLRLCLNEVNIVESKEGETNTLAILPRVREFAKLDTTNNTALGLKFAGIETLNLTLGRVHHLSMKRPEQRSVVELGLKNEIFTDIQELSELRDRVFDRLIQRGVVLSSTPNRLGGSGAPPPLEADEPRHAEKRSKRQ